MIRNSVSQITRYYVWINNILKYIIYKSIKGINEYKIKGINELEAREEFNLKIQLSD